MYIIDMLDYLRDYDLDLIKVRPDDAHPTTMFANELVANIIYKKLIEQNLIEF